MKSTVILKASLIYFTVFIFSLYRSLLFSNNMMYHVTYRKEVNAQCYICKYDIYIFIYNVLNFNIITNTNLILGLMIVKVTYTDT